MQTVLVANRGEIAVRVIDTVKRQGYHSVAVYSDADANALHVQRADLALSIGPAAAADSYLSIEKIIAAAISSGADAIHPGYGFLSENAAFARACAAENIVFIGPSADAIELMGRKRQAKLAMLEAGVPCIPGYQGEDQDDEALIAQAEQIGLPVMIKASAGGGGRGMRLVHDSSELASAMASARSEAQAAFGSGELILEKALLDPRHIEIQIFADQHGNAVYLGERDCSIQRRHQKVVEEAPSPFVDDALRKQMGKAAVAVAKACDYCGAGTVEFLVDQDRQFYFLEMNTRLQVEHPVTEAITGQDLVAWQLAVAAGQPLPLTQEQIHYHGHAIEVRLYAEDPRQQFLPQSGDILHWQVPEHDGVRVDSGIQTGSSVSAFYDPMLAKVIAHGETRADAIRRLGNGLADIQLLGVNHNKHFLQQLLAKPAFAGNDVTTAFIDRYCSDLVASDSAAPPVSVLAVAATLLFCRGIDTRYQWSAAAPAGLACELQYDADRFPIQLSQIVPGSFSVQIEYDDALQTVSLKVLDNLQQFSSLVSQGQITYALDDQPGSLHYHLTEEVITVEDASGHYQLNNITYQAAGAAGGQGSGELTAVMDGAIIDINVAAGDVVKRGDVLAVMEAMKMEHPLKAGISGTVERVHVNVGQQLKTRQLILTIHANDGVAQD